MRPSGQASDLGLRQRCRGSRSTGSVTTLGWRRASSWATRMALSRSPSHSTTISRNLPLPYLYRRRKWRRFQFRAAVASSWRTRMYDVRSAGQVECRWREGAFASYWDRTVNTGARGGGYRCGPGRLGSLARIYTGTAGWGPHGVPLSSESFRRHFSSVNVSSSMLAQFTQ